MKHSLKTFLLTESTEIWYHGSDHEISGFSLDHLGTGTNIDQEGPGIYLTSDIDDARTYGKNVYKVTANVNNAKILKDTVKSQTKASFIERLIKTCPDQDDLYNWDENKSRGVYKAAESIIKHSDNYRKALEQVWYDFYRHTAKLFLERVTSKGWQGFKVPRAQGTIHFICWYPSILTLEKLIL